MDMKDEVKAVEAEVVSEAEKIKASALAQKADFEKQLAQVKTDMTKLQQDFEAKKILGVRLEGAIQSLEILLKSLVK